MTSRPARFPPAVRPGDRIGVAALSGPVDAERLRAGIATLEGLGFETRVARNVRGRSACFAGTDEERLEGFHDLVVDPTVKAILFARGGHGVLRLLPHIDWSLLRRVPKSYVGYSDVTPLLLAITQRLGLVTIHGPMVAVELADGLTRREAELLLSCLAGDLPLAYPLRTSGGRIARGPLLGGCLSLLVSTLGTPYAPQLQGSVLFLEETREPLYRFDRMLTHLRLSGSLSAVEALVFGHLSQVGEATEEAELDGLLLALARILKGSAVGEPAIGRGLECGHARPNLSLALGAQACLDPDIGRLTVDRG